MKDLYADIDDACNQMKERLTNERDEAYYDTEAAEGDLSICRMQLHAAKKEVAGLKRSNAELSEKWEKVSQKCFAVEMETARLKALCRHWAERLRKGGSPLLVEAELKEEGGK